MPPSGSESVASESGGSGPIIPGSITVAFQGNPGAYGEIAALNAVPEAGTQRQTRGYPTFHGVAQAVESGEAQYGVLPVENSLMGAIHQAIDLLSDTELYVIGEVWNGMRRYGHRELGLIMLTAGFLVGVITDLIVTLGGA